MQQINNAEDGFPDVDSDIEIGQIDDVARDDELEARGQGRRKKRPFSGLLKLSIYGVFGLVFVCVALMIYLKSLPKGNDEMQLVQSQVDLVSGKTQHDENRNDAPKLSTQSVLTQKVVGDAVAVVPPVSDQKNNITPAVLDEETISIDKNEPYQIKVLARIDDIEKQISKNLEKIDDVSNIVKTTQDETAAVKYQIQSATDRIAKIESDNVEIKTSMSNLGARIKDNSIVKNDTNSSKHNTNKNQQLGVKKSVSASRTEKYSRNKQPLVVQPPLVKPSITLWGNDKFVQFYVNGTPYEVREGEMLAGWRVVKIYSDSVDVVKITGGSVVRVVASGG